MGKPAYYLEDASPIDPVELPRAPKPESLLYDETDEGIHLQTGRGVSWDYGQFTKRTPVYIFRVPDTQLQQLLTFHHAVVVDGRRDAFYFIRDVDESPLNVLHCKKQLSFKPVFVNLGLFNGVIEQWWDLSVELEEEITAADVED